MPVSATWICTYSPDGPESPAQKTGSCRVTLCEERVKAPAVWHRIPRVDTEIEEDLVKFHGVAFDLADAQDRKRS